MEIIFWCAKSTVNSCLSGFSNCLLFGFTCNVCSQVLYFFKCCFCNRNYHDAIVLLFYIAAYNIRFHTIQSWRDLLFRIQQPTSSGMNTSEHRIGEAREPRLQPDSQYKFLKFYYPPWIYHEIHHSKLHRYFSMLVFGQFPWSSSCLY